MILLWLLSHALLALIKYGPLLFAYSTVTDLAKFLG